eukprot:scaffold38698_cov73-Cyclotella_meneghiniana.AAC.2
MTTKRCTCAPHPRIDLTDAYTKYHSSATYTDQQNSSSETEEIHKACSSHGCFHVSIRHPTFDPDRGSISMINCLSKTSKVELDIESLFSPSFLNDAASNACDMSNTSTFKWEDICNGGTRVAHYIDDSGSVQTGTFRGRSAESGDEENSVPEPKLSWEFQRCISTIESSKTKQLVSKSSNATPINEQRKLLPQWTEALHSIAAVVIHLLGIPSGLVLQEKPCECSYQVPIHERSKKCNIDLIRVFRYDALQSNDITLGSSAHSDWGTLTVVWQDGKGGLQTYCDLCDKWSDVDASAMHPDNNSDNSNNDDVINFFVHIGDFLSLATMQSDGSSTWHSPRHRVLCPSIRSCNKIAKEPNFNSQCRRSLVYFAYPPPGISLKDAQNAVRSLAKSNANDNFNSATPSTHSLSKYSVLHNQSAHHALSEQKQLQVGNSYDNILHIPFDEVITEKWVQVQRK